MSSKKMLNKNSNLPNNDQESETGASGQGGSIAFHDFVTSSANWRDDELPFDEQKRMLIVHQDLHEIKVKAQKDKREQYKQLKEGKIPLQAYRETYATGANAQFKTNPVLANKAQFSGIDRQVNQLPTENTAETNPEQRNELRNELRYELGYQHTPTFNPKPRGPGY